MMNEIINKEIGGMGFGFYSAEVWPPTSSTRVTNTLMWLLVYDVVNE
jgi:hypothetical protein